MGQIRLPGLLTGIDTAALIEQLMIINSRRLATYQVQKINYETKTTAINELRSKVSSLNSAVGALSSAEKLETFNVSTSDKDILTASATSDANPGSHSVEIDQLATGETWIQDTSTFDYKTDYVGGGTFIYSYNAKESIITTVADETTLEDFVNLINDAADNPGVTASLLNHGGKYHLMLSGQETGTDHQISINAGSTEVWQADSAFTVSSENATMSTKIVNLDQFGGAPLEGGEVIEITGTDYYNNPIDPTPLNLSLTNNTTLGHLIDKINEAFDENVIATLVAGKIVVTDSVPGDGSTSSSDLSIALNYEPGTSAATLDVPTMFVSTAGTGNSTTADLTLFAPGTFIQTQNAQDSQIKIDGYPSVTPVGEVQTMELSSRTNGGQIYLTYKGETTASIPYTASAADIQAALELLSNVNAGDITVTSAPPATPLNNNPPPDMIFTFLDTFGDVPMILVKNELTGPSTPDVTITETTKGISEWISKNSNSLSDILEGVTLNLLDITPVDNPVEITLSRNTTAVSNKITQMVGAYNSLISFLAEKTEYNSETKKMGILSGDIAVSFIKTQANNPIVGIVPGFTDTIDTLIQAFDIGITLDGAGKMKFNTSTFNDAIEEDFMGVLELLGADGTGNSDGDIIKFYAASKKYTTAGTYDVEVVVADVEGSNWITSAKIKLSSESVYRDATWPGGLVTGNSEFGDNGPLYPENGLQLTVDLSNEGTFTETVRVKQGFAGALEDLLTEIIKTDGRLDISEEIVEDRITDIESRIRREEDRLEMIETRLIEKYARLEKTLAMLQQQMSAVSVVSQMTFGS